MKKISMILGSALMMLTVGCTTDTTKEVVNNDNKAIIGLSVDGTRTSLGDKTVTEYPVLWSAGDKVAVNGVASEPLAAEYAGKTAAQFTVTGVAAPFDVIYPADVLMADGTIGISEIQEYVAGSFAQGSAVMVGHSDTPNGVIKNLYGFVKVPILKGDEKTVKSVTLHSNNLEAMTGTFAVDYVNAALEPLSGMDFVKVTAADGIPFVEDKAEVVIAVPAGTYANGFTVKIVATDGTAMTAKAYTANGITIAASTLLAMPEVQFYPNETVSEITDAVQLQAFLDAASAGAYDNYKNENGEVLLGSDIDMTGVTLKSATTFDGVFNGQGYAIKNWKTDGAALFAQVDAGAVVKNIVIDASCEMNVSATNAGNKGFIANYNLGTISGCANDAPIVLEIETATKQYMIGAIVGLSGSKSEALVTNCINNGDITIKIGSMTASSYYFGGVVGDTSGKADTVCCMSNCINNGDITVNIDGADGWKNVYLGGVAGANNNKGVVSECINNGKVDFYLDKAYKGAYPNVGGITGYSAAHFTGCKNTGDVSIRTNTYKASDYPQITRPAIGGIAGYVNGDVTGCENHGHVLLQGTADVRFQPTTSYTSGGVGNMGHPVIGGVCGSVGYPIEKTVTAAKTRTIKDCTNYGFVELINPASTTWAPIGGVVGLPTGTIANCTNAKGAVVKVTMGSTQTYCGGVYGCTVNESNTISDCANYGKVWFAASNAQALGKQTTRSYAGGISGGYQTGSGNKASNCVNEGEVLAEAANTTMIVAGLFAAHNGTITDCTNNGSITVKNALALDAGVSELGGIVGYVNGDLTNCSSYGTITNNSNAGTDTGAIIGAQGGAKTVKGGVIDCTIVAPDSNVGIILGSTRSADVAVTLGTADAPIVISTKTTINGVAVTAADAADANKLAGILRAGSLTITNVVVE